MAPSQDGTPQRIESGKQRALRVPLDYYKGWDKLQWSKIILTGIALIAALGWWGVGLASRKQSQVMYSHGPVARAHADIEAECAACHVPWHPITGQKGPALLFSDFHVSDARCEVCHGPADVTKNGAGGAHHKSQKAEDTNSCGGCHRDHQGREFSLVQLKDADCTSCHRDVKAHMTGSPRFANAITRFEKDHPQFAALDANNPRAGDRGKLKFNHALHTTAGLTTGLTYNNIPEADRRDFGGKAGMDPRPVQLECSVCHKTDANGPGAPVPDEPYGPEVKRRLDGAYMQPISYGNQCRACHPITDHLNNPLPHGLQPPELQGELARALGNTTAKKNAEPRAGQRAVPGNALSVQQIQEDSAEDQMRKAQRFLYLGRANCGECHYSEGPKDKDVPDRIIPPDVPAVWFQHALFNHQKHEKMNCRDCHANAATSTVHTDILIPGVENCKQCHAQGGNTTYGTASDRCTECHRYHHGDQAFMALQMRREKRPWRDTAELIQELAGEKRPRTRP